MQNTNKKFFDKKNIIGNQDGNIKSTFQKNQQTKNTFFQSNQQKEVFFSKPYQPEDEYADLSDVFQRGKYDIGYQVLQNAFPWKSQFSVDFTSLEAEESLLNQFQYNFKEINSCRELRQIQLQQFPQFEEECIQFFEIEESDSEAQQSLDQQQSTKDNSNSLKQDGE